jgi:hypothetical protein
MRRSAGVQEWKEGKGRDLKEGWVTSFPCPLSASSNINLPQAPLLLPGTFRATTFELMIRLGDLVDERKSCAKRLALHGAG